VALVPQEEQVSRPLCGHWTLKDLLGHIADWEQIGVDGLRHMAAGQPPQVEHIQDIEAWNQAHVQAHRDDPWEQIWDHVRRSRQALRDLVERMTEADLARSFPIPWLRDGSAYGWVSVFFVHDREHARDLHSACLNLP